MGDPQRVVSRLASAEDAFEHADGRPRFEPGLNARPDAEPGEVQIQKACRLLELSGTLDELGAYYGAILEHSFMAIEQTLQGYLLAVTGVDERELRDHTQPYELAKGRVPLSEETIDRLVRLYDARRTDHYYGTTVTTAQQADRMQAVARAVHDYILQFDPEIGRFCNCPTADH